MQFMKTPRYEVCNEKGEIGMDRGSIFTCLRWGYVVAVDSVTNPRINDVMITMKNTD